MIESNAVSQTVLNIIAIQKLYNVLLNTECVYMINDIINQFMHYIPQNWPIPNFVSLIAAAADLNLTQKPLSLACFKYIWPRRRHFLLHHFIYLERDGAIYDRVERL